MFATLHRHFTRHPALSLRWPLTVIIIGLMGMIDSGYLTYSHYAQTVLPCPTIESVNTCQVVATSVYSNILGVPLALIGLGFYATIIAIGLISLKEKFQFALNFIPPLAALAWLFSVRLTYLQFFVIHSVCYYCIFSALLATILLVMGVMMMRKIDN